VASRIRTFQHVLEGFKVRARSRSTARGGSTFSDWWAYKMEAHDAIPYNAAVMAAKGVRVSLNSDSNELARRLYWEAAQGGQVRGVSEDEALKMVTATRPGSSASTSTWARSRSARTPTCAIFSAPSVLPRRRGWR
jgi:hypothetical protein